MKKRLKIFLMTALILVFAGSMAAFSGCKKDNSKNWNVSASGKTVKAKITDDNKGGYILNVEGTGAIKDFSSRIDPPWCEYRNKISEIKLSEGITEIGTNAFSAVEVGRVVIPKSVTTIYTDAFSDNTVLYLYGDVAVYAGAKTLLYSETEPSSEGYWHFVDGKPEKWGIKVLFIGNSFTFYSNIPGIFGELAKGAGKNVTVESVTNGSWTLSKFADKTDEYGAKVHAKLTASDDYDAIILQDQSTRPLANKTGFVSGIKAMAEKINSTQKSCRIYLYATWGFEEYASKNNMTIPQMEAKIRAEYASAAKEIGATVCNVGKAFTEVYTENNDINLYYSEDNKHPSYNGAFLSACVHVSTILGIDPRTSNFNGSSEITPEVAAILKQAAYVTVFG